MQQRTKAVMRRMEAAVRTAQHGPCALLPDSPLVVGVSGGPDSTALLYALHRVWPGPAPAPLIAAYFDHGVRPPAIVAAERAHVAAMTATLAIPLVTGEPPQPPRLTPDGRLPEAPARRDRYRFLGEVATAHAAPAVAVGHTASDQAETVLLRIIRGTGVAGLGAMDWRADWPLGGSGPALVRPLLGVSRADTVAYCAALGLQPRHDEENDLPGYRRNRVRHELVPLLATFNPQIERALVGLATSARHHTELLDELVTAAWPSLCDAPPAGSDLALHRPVLAGMPVAVRRHALRRALAIWLAEDSSPVDRALLDRLDWAIVAPGNRRIMVEGAHTIVVEGGHLTFWPAPHPYPVLVGSVRLERDLPVGGETTLGGWSFTSALAAARPAQGLEGDAVWLRPELAARGLWVRFWRAGDSMRLPGVAGRKKLQDIFTDAKVPRDQRVTTPILLAGDTILWVAGLRLAAGASATAGSPALRITARRESGRQATTNE